MGKAIKLATFIKKYIDMYIPISESEYLLNGNVLAKTFIIEFMIYLISHLDRRLDSKRLNATVYIV